MLASGVPTSLSLTTATQEETAEHCEKGQSISEVAFMVATHILLAQWAQCGFDEAATHASCLKHGHHLHI